MAIAHLRNDYFVEGAHNVYFVNGVLAETISDIPAGILICNITHAGSGDLSTIDQLAGARQDAFAALNTAYADRGLFLKVPRNTSVHGNIVIHHIVRCEATFFFNVRNLIHIEENAEVSLTEVHYPATGKVFYNNLTELFTDPHARVKHNLVQNGGYQFYNVDTLCVQQERSSTYSHTVFTYSGALVRNNLGIALNDEFAECHLYGLTLSRNQQNVDHHTLVDHQKPNCQSNELYKGIAGDRSSLTFNGQIFVEKDAQKTNAYQSSKNILLSDDATVNAKPELEIYANDVKCSHGTSTGKVDENALFYLKSRGIGEDSARKLLLHAFAHEVISKVKDSNTALFVENLFEHSLN